MTRRQELILAGVGALLVAIAGTMLLVRPAQQATAEAHADREAAIAESQSLRDQVKALEALKPREAELKAQAALVKGEFPATPALPGLVDALQDSAGLAGVELGTVAPAAPTASTVNPQLAEIITTLSVRGGYFEIQDFLVRLENLVKGSSPERVPPRSMLIRSVNLADASDEGTGDAAASDATASPDELQGNIVLVVFQLAQPSGTSSTPAAPAAPAGQGAQVR